MISRTFGYASMHLPRLQDVSSEMSVEEGDWCSPQDHSLSSSIKRRVIT